MSNLMLHSGAREVTPLELTLVEAPKATKTWYPLKHSDVLIAVQEALDAAGFQVEDQQLGLTRNDQRFFGTLKLRTELVPGVHLAVGIRNSIDKSLPIGFCAGHRVLVCDNLAFSAELIIIRKHTRHGREDFQNRMASSMQTLQQYKEAEAAKIARWQKRELSDDQSNSYMLKAFEQHLVSSRQLPRVIETWRKPEHDDFRPRTAWSLLNAFTDVLKERQANPDFARRTINLQRLLSNGHVNGHRGAEEENAGGAEENGERGA